MRSDWLLKLGMVSAVRLKAFRAPNFPHFLEKRNYLGLAIYWFGIILKQLFTSLSVKSGRYLQLAITIHLHFGE